MTLHLDTSLLIDIVTARSPHIAVVRQWLKDGHQLGASAIAWSEFCNGPLSKEQKDAVFGILERRVSAFTREHAELASRLFHHTGRRRGSHADCMIAASAMAHGVPVATRNIKEFEKFAPYGVRMLPVAAQAA
jgi:predicted nucleic acid-binding protein